MQHHLTVVGPGLLAARRRAPALPRARLSWRRRWRRHAGRARGRALGLSHLRRLPARMPGVHRAHAEDRRHAARSRDDRLAYERRGAAPPQEHRRPHAPLGRLEPRSREWSEDLDVKVLGSGETRRVPLLGRLRRSHGRAQHEDHARDGEAPAARPASSSRILGPEESCTGDPARRAATSTSTRCCAKANVETLNGYGVKKIVTTCPHCFNTLKNEYPDFGGKYEVVHHTEFIAGSSRAGRLQLSKQARLAHLPRPLLPRPLQRASTTRRARCCAVSRAAASSELPRNRSSALCCGAGGGYAFMDDDPGQAHQPHAHRGGGLSGAGTAAVSCPFCMQMFEDALAPSDPQHSRAARHRRIGGGGAGGLAVNEDEKLRRLPDIEAIRDLARRYAHGVWRKDARRRRPFHRGRRDGTGDRAPLAAARTCARPISGSSAS